MNMEHEKVLEKLNRERVRMPFGKHKGITVNRMAQIDLRYCVWLMSLEDLDPFLKTTISYFVRKHHPRPEVSDSEYADVIAEGN